MTELTALMPAVASYPAAVWERTRLDLLHILDIAAIAVLLDDDTLMVEQIRWLADVLAARAVPADALPYGLSALLSTDPRNDLSNDIRPLLTAAQDALAIPGRHLE